MTLKRVNRLLLGLLLLSLAGCTLTIIHRYEYPYTGPNTPPQPPQVADPAPAPTPTPTPPPPVAGEEEANAETGTLTIVSDPDFEETIRIYVGAPASPGSQFVTEILPSETSVDIPATVGQVLYFEVNQSNSILIDPYRVKELGIKHQLKLGQRFGQARPNYERVANADASRLSYDIFYIDPFSIDRKMNDSGGARGQIFEKLRDQDRDWNVFDGDIALKKAFIPSSIYSGTGGTTTEAYYSSSSFKQGFSANIEVSGGAAGAKGSKSLGFSKMSLDQAGGGEVYTFARKTDSAYSISLSLPDAELTQAFKEAIMALPPVINPAGDLTKMPEAASYVSFRKTWGTHYPTRVVYGGMYIAYERTSLQDFYNMESYSVDFASKAEVPVGPVTVGGGIGLGYSQEETFFSSSSNGIMSYLYVGGRSKSDGWEVSKDDVQPIRIRLERLTDLVDPRFFQDEIAAGYTTEAKLAGIRHMLGAILTAYIGSETDAGVPQIPTDYHLTVNDFYVSAVPFNDSKPHVYGKVEITHEKKVNNSWTSVEHEVVWHRSDASGARVIVYRGYREPFPSSRNALRVRLDPKQGEDPQNHRFKVYIRLFKWNGTGWHDCIGEATKYINFFTDIGTYPPDNYTIQFAGGSYGCNQAAVKQELDIDVNTHGSLSGDDKRYISTWNISLNAKVVKLDFGTMREFFGKILR